MNNIYLGINTIKSHNCRNNHYVIYVTIHVIYVTKIECEAMMICIYLQMKAYLWYDIHASSHCFSSLMSDIAVLLMII